MLTQNEIAYYIANPKEIPDNILNATEQFRVKWNDYVLNGGSPPNTSKMWEYNQLVNAGLLNGSQK